MNIFILFLIFFNSFIFYDLKAKKKEVVKKVNEKIFFDKGLEDIDDEYDIEDNFIEDIEINSGKKDKIFGVNQGEGLSSLQNFAPGDNTETYLCSSQLNNKDVKIETNGKIRIDGLTYSNNTKYINSQNGGLDKTFSLGKSTLDIGYVISFGEKKYGREIVSFGIDMRNRSVWGKTDDTAMTTFSSISDGDYKFGSHSHGIGVPLIFIRGFDLTFDLNAFFNIKDCPIQKFKTGFFPFNLGRGISLGSAYAVSPDFISYDPGNVIQEYAPGFMFYGDLMKDGQISYKSYLGILRNLSSNFLDINEYVNEKVADKKYFPQRGFGVLNIVSALQFDYKCMKKEKTSLTLSPYGMFYHKGEGFNSIIGDSSAELATFGFALDGNQNNFSFGFEFAKNFGRQYIKSIDRNKVIKENRVITVDENSETSAMVLVNSHVDYIGDSFTTDLNNKKSTFLGNSSSRQKVINGVFNNQSQNGMNIEYTTSDGRMNILKNSSDRFRSGYSNELTGWMFVADGTYNFKLNEKKSSFSLATGLASGDESPNSPLEHPDDYIKDSRYEGFIGVQEIYSGKAVKSVFMMSGSGKVPRILSVPALNNDSLNIGVPIGYPEKISRFTNLFFLGSSFSTELKYKDFNFKFNPNLIYYAQVTAPIIYNSNLREKLGRECLPNSLGVELNLFTELTTDVFKDFKFFGTGTLFIPGSYYTVLKKIPLDSKQESYMNSLSNNLPAVKTPLIGNDVAFFINLGFEIKY